MRARDATKVYVASGAEPVRALDAVSLEVAAGEMVALVGPSGCGKSTLLNLIGCVDLPTSGAIEVAGAATSSLRDNDLTRLRREAVGTVFQFFNLLPAMTIGENVALPLILQRRPRAEIAKRLQAALDSVDIADKADAYPSQVSGGQLQRAAIARATIHAPSIVLADEPTGNLDSHNGAAVLRLLRTFASRGQAILMATHAIEATAVCDRIIRMQEGRIVG
ncbi:MAG: ABC transporter ATP-binding protein [Candidatus Eremiobacteraeota bacterium]|nr:ABC transporter ATP-binding protein [Candidatus Eremiobacteraeota bacterium]